MFRMLKMKMKMEKKVYITKKAPPLRGGIIFAVCILKEWTFLDITQREKIMERTGLHGISLHCT